MIVERVFRVRHYECNPNGFVNHTHYLRYMQETAFDAAAAAGFPIARYEAMNRAWFIRETDITYKRPLRYGDSVRVRTWVVDFRRVRSQRVYELVHEESGELVALAVTDWVYVNLTTGRPVSIPDEMVAAFWPDGAPAEAPERERFVPLPAMPATAFVLPERVKWRDLDSANHVNNAMYVSYFEDAQVAAMQARGWTPARLRSEGLLLLARRMRIEYRVSAVMQDALSVATWVTEMGRTGIERAYAITRAGSDEQLVRGRGQWVCVDAETLTPRRISAEMRADLCLDSPAAG